MPVHPLLVVVDMIVMGPLRSNGYSELPRIRTLSKRWLAMDVCSASYIPAFRQHKTIQMPSKSNQTQFLTFHLE
jgi:hypothetical protein